MSSKTKNLLLRVDHVKGQLGTEVRRFTRSCRSVFGQDSACPNPQLSHTPIIKTVTFSIESTECAGESETLQKFEWLEKVQNFRNVFACLFFMFRPTDCLGLFIGLNTERKTLFNQSWMHK